jgi:hypothetical protein
MALPSIYQAQTWIPTTVAAWGARVEQHGASVMTLPDLVHLGAVLRSLKRRAPFTLERMMATRRAIKRAVMFQRHGFG